MTPTRVERLMAPWLADLEPYRVEDAGGMVKLDAMENPYSFPEDLIDPWLDKLRETALNRYPDPGARDLKKALVASVSLDAQLDLIIGNGSDELIHLLLAAYGQRGANILCPEPTFAVYRLATQSMGAQFHGVPLRTPDFSIDEEAMLAAIETLDPALIFLATPNNPTGNTFAPNAIEAICAASRGLVVIDEAYFRFAGTSLLPRLAELENVVIMQTLSKIGMASLRVGMLYGAPAWLEPLNRIRMPYNISSLSQVSACFALQHEYRFVEQIEMVVQNRDSLFLKLQETVGVHVWPSKTNFFLLRTDNPANEVFTALRERGILVKNLHGSHPSLENCLRVTVGTPEENTRFLDALSVLASA